VSSHFQQSISINPFRVRQILNDSDKCALIKQCVENGDIVLKPDLEISCNVGSQTDVLNILQAFNPSYLCLVLDALLMIRIDYISELSFMEHLEKLAHKHIFHSPAIAKNKKYVYTRGNWLTEEGLLRVFNILIQLFRKESRRTPLLADHLPDFLLDGAMRFAASDS
jgi:hypothetical protein